MPLDAGENRIVLEATNVFGATAELQLAITRAASMAPPVLRGLTVLDAAGKELPVRKDRQVFFGAGSRLQVRCDDPAARVVCNGVALTRAGDGSVSMAEVLTEPCKPMRVSLLVANDAGESEEFPFIGWLDVTPPTLQTSGAVSAPRGQPFWIEGTWVDEGGLQRNGTTIDKRAARLAPGGGIAKKGTWRIEHPGLDGNTTLKVVMLDRAGNRAELQVPVTVQER